MSDPDSASVCSVSPCSDDGFLNRKITIRQPKDGPRSGMDAVILAAAVSRTHGAVMDAGAGSGVAALCLAFRLPTLSITGVEIQPSLAALLEHNIRTNNMHDRVRAVCADLTAPMRQVRRSGLTPDSFAQVITNPPFHKTGTVSPPKNPATAKARLMDADNDSPDSPVGGLRLWVRRCRAFLKPDGILTMIHRADALGDILDAVASQFAGLRIIPLHPAAGQPASRVILHARRQGQASLSLMPPLILHEADGSFTPQTDAILRDGAALCP